MTSSGGFLAPAHLPRTFVETYRVRWFWRRWWLRRQGWSTEWTVEYEWGTRPVRDSLPTFSAERRGITIA